ncbi:MAG TPA: hypothetical protein DDY98_03815 [Ruminococcaceae bacterium]|nr:hypothetical protein [Oscillospiraceae bacterium]
MGAGFHGGFGGTFGSSEQKEFSNQPNKHYFRKNKEPIFNESGHVTSKSISARAEFFLGKSVAKLENVLHKHGYETIRRPSKHSTSKAKIIVTTNPSKDRNITQIQVSPGSKRHGNVPYVKISTSDEGKFKIIGASQSEYKSDGKETAKIIFRRNNRK